MKGDAAPGVSGGATPRRHALALGMMKIADGPAALYTVVATGYALAAVSASGAPAGGLIHLDPSLGSERASPPFGTQRDEGTEVTDMGAHARARVHAFVAGLCALGIEATSLHFELVGGAHLLDALPRAQREFLAARVVASVATLLEQHGARLAQSDVGGAELRTVEVDTGTRAIHITAGVKGSRAARGAAPAHASAASERGVAPRAASAAGPHDGATGERTAPRPTRARASFGQNERTAKVFVEMGRLHVDRAPARLVAVLGSCVAVSIFDRAFGVGGLAHVMLPRHPGGDAAPAKYADTAVPALCAALTALGARTARFEARLAGGSNTLFQATEEGLWRIPADNARIARAALAEAGIELVSEDTGGRVARRVTLDLASFELDVTMLPRPP